MMREKKFTGLMRGWAVGSTAFRAELRERLKKAEDHLERFSLPGSERPAVLAARAELWEDQAAGACARLRDPARPAAEEEVSRGKTPARRGDETHDLGAGPLARAAPADGRAQQRGDAGAPVSPERRSRPAGDQRDFIQNPSMAPWTEPIVRKNENFDFPIDFGFTPNVLTLLYPRAKLHSEVILCLGYC